MADVRNWGSFLRGRWNWSSFGYEQGFPRGSQFTDIDAVVEFDGKKLILEPKQYDGVGPLPPLPPKGQLLFLEEETRAGAAVLILYGCGVCNDPHAVYDVGRGRWFDWRGKPKEARRGLLKKYIDGSMGVVAAASEGAE